MVFAGVSYGVLPAYAAMSSDSPEVIREVTVYGRIVCVASVGLFCESVWTKVLQAEGDMKTPMLAQIAGALTNIVLDPILIFGWGVPAMGIAGAAIATVAGQIVCAAPGLSAFARPPGISGVSEAHLPVGNAQHSDAAGIHLLYFGAEFDFVRFF